MNITATFGRSPVAAYARPTLNAANLVATVSKFNLSPPHRNIQIEFGHRSLNKSTFETVMNARGNILSVLFLIILCSVELFRALRIK